MTPEPMLDRDLADLRLARRYLHTTSLAIRVANLLGKPLETGLRLLPRSANEAIQTATAAALRRALGVAVSTMSKHASSSRDRLHSFAAAASGAFGGFFGLSGLAVELPVTTVIMLRSIGDIARSEGHDLADPATRMECLSVFALGGPLTTDDAAETGYFALRAALAKTLGDAATHVARRGLAAEGAPVLVRLLEKIATRYGVVVQEKAALEAVPVVGAIGGSMINTLFIDHFQERARGHFIVRRLERRYGTTMVRAAWDRIEDEENAPR
jgi:hypothetical protein